MCAKRSFLIPRMMHCEVGGADAGAVVAGGADAAAAAAACVIGNPICQSRKNCWRAREGQMERGGGKSLLSLRSPLLAVAANTLTKYSHVLS